MSASQRRRAVAGSAVARNVALLVLACFLNQFGFQAVYFVGFIGSATYELGVDAYAVSLLVLVLNVTFVLGISLAGIVIDRVGPRLTLVAATAMMAVLGVVALLVPLSIPSLVALALLAGLSASVSSTSIDVFPRFLTEDTATLARMNSLTNLTISLSVIVGPLAAGAVTAAFSNQAVFALLAIAAVPSVVVCLLLRELISRDDTAGDAAEGTEGGGRCGSSMLAELLDGVRVTMAHPDLSLLMVIGFLGYLGFGAFDSLESLYYRDVLHAGAEWMGWLTAIVGVGATLGALAPLRIPARRMRMSLLCALLFVEGLGAMLYVGTGSIACACVGQLVLGLANGAIGPIRSTLTQARCDVAYVGRVMALMRVALNSAGILPLLVAPALSDVFGVQAVMFAASALVALVGLGTLVHVKAHGDVSAE